MRPAPEPRRGSQTPPGNLTSSPQLWAAGNKLQPACAWKKQTHTQTKKKPKKNNSFWPWREFWSLTVGATNDASVGAFWVSAEVIFVPMCARLIHWSNVSPPSSRSASLVLLLLMWLVSCDFTPTRVLLLCLFALASSGDTAIPRQSRELHAFLCAEIQVCTSHVEATAWSVVKVERGFLK